MADRWLISGGARSGKSRYALSLAEAAEFPFYIATGWAVDEEMAARIKRHQAERGDHWRTIETKTGIREAIKQAVSAGADFIVVDCITLWVSNLLFEGYDVERAAAELCESLPESPRLVFVTNELGSGIVPENELARHYRDTAGLVNQLLGAKVENLVLTICGQPIKVK